MPRFYFNIEDHVQEVDDEGVELPGQAEARVQGIRFAGAVLSEDPELLSDERPLKVRVVNADRTVLIEIVVQSFDRC